MAEVARTFVQELAKGVELAVEDAKQGWREISPAITQGCANLVREGWFPDDDWPWSTLPDLASTDVAGHEQDLVEHFEERAADICERASREYPDRRGILEQAFSAHERGEFALSTPVLIAQAEGITVEVLGEPGYQACSAKGSVPSYRLGKHLDDRSLDDVLLRPFFEAFVRRPPVVATEADRQAIARPGLNRHLVLHGMDTSYGTRANSCRAMSLLNWVCSVLSEKDVRKKP